MFGIRLNMCLRLRKTSFQLIQRAISSLKPHCPHKNLFRWQFQGIRVVKMAIGKNEKLESFELESLKLETFCSRWKECSEVENNPAKFERVKRGCKEPGDVDLSNFNSSFPISLILSNLAENFPTSLVHIQPKLSNFSPNFPTSFFPLSCRYFQLKTFQLLVFFLCWRLFSLCWWFFQCTWSSVFNRSPTS